MLTGRTHLLRRWPWAAALLVWCIMLVPAAFSGGEGARLASAAVQPGTPTAVPVTNTQHLPMLPLYPAPAANPDAMRASDFGLVWVNSSEEPRSSARVDRAVASGARLDRFPLYWNLMEPSPGRFQWEKQDAALSGNELRGLGTLAILLGEPGFYYPGQQGLAGAPAAVSPLPPVGGSFLRNTPGGTTGSSQAGCSAGGPPAPRDLYASVFSDGSDRPGPGKMINPANPWARFVDAVVDRYRPGGTAGLHVRYWEVWNEPDLCQFWSGSAQEYARLVKVAYLAIKHRDPQATVIWGGLAHYEQPQFLYDLINTLHDDPLSAEFHGFFDAAAGHHYAIIWNGYQWTARVRAALDNAGWNDKPIWITESGVPVCNDYPGPACPSPWRATPEEQAAYIWQNVAYTRMAGGGPIFQFNLHDDCGNVVAPNSPDGFGLMKNEATSYCSPANAEPRLAYTAFKLANRYFPGTELLWADVQSLSAGRARRFAFYDPASHERRMLVFALDEAEVTINIPATGAQARRVALDGSEVALSPANGEYQITLPGATNRNSPNGSGGFDTGIYGVPYLLIERDTLPPNTQIEALPESSPPSFPIRWSARDAGSGVVAVTVYVQQDDRPWTVWLPNQPAQGSATFEGEVGHHYRFAVLGTDRAGNRLGQPVAQAETWTTDQETPQVVVNGTVQNMQGQPAVGVTVSIADVSTATDENGAFALMVPTGHFDVLVAGQAVLHGRNFSSTTNLALLQRPGLNAVVNGDFAAGTNGWEVTGSCPAAVETQAESLDRMLHLATAFVPNVGVPGEEGSAGGNSTVSQKLRVPTGHPFLVLRYRVDSLETSAGHDRFEVVAIRDGEPDYLLVQETASDWQYRSVDLAAYAGAEITLVLNLYQSSPNRATSGFVELVAIGE